MNAWKHSVSSASYFGGVVSDYLEIHRFIDSSKFFIYDAKHRLLLHHLFGMELCEELFGITIENSQQQQVPTREVVAQHLREDLSGRVPTLHDWFAASEDRLGSILQLPEGLAEDLESFVLRPFLRSGLRASLTITYSHFGVFIAHRLHGLDFAKRLAEALPVHHRMHILFGNFKMTQKWQSTIDYKALTQINQQIDKDTTHASEITDIQSQEGLHAPRG